MLYVYIAPTCEKNAASIGMSTEVERLKEKLIREQSTAGLRRHPKPFLKKSFGRTRLIITELIDGEDVVLCFLRHVYKHEIGDEYESYFASIRVPRNDDPEIVEFLAQMRAAPIRTKPEMSDLELEYLHVARGHDSNAMAVMESPLWVRSMATIRETPGKQGLLMPIWEALQGLCEQDADTRAQSSEARQEKYGITVLYRFYPDINKLFLIAPLEDCGNEAHVREARAILDSASSFDETRLLRHSARAYPDFVIYDREIWETMQASIEANLALSPEESDILDHVLDPAKEGGFPLFINGRPGSGKSTILQYLFADFLHAHLTRQKEMRLSVPPLYLTYNERLLQNAKGMVEDIFKCNAEKLVASERVNLGNAAQREEFNTAFAYFREFLLSLSPTKGRFERRLYVDFHRFKAKYSTELQRGDAKLRKLSPEVAWHTLRTYIKGKSDSAGKDDAGEYFDPASYAELPRDEITVSSDIYELVWDKVWNGWYRGLCEHEGYWDDQDLARHILGAELATSTYPAIFCDESQDFTTIELELIFRLSLYSERRVDPYYLSRIPFAFAGDPFQTLNPTGFRWDAIKANFHTNIVQQLDPARRSRVAFTFKELAYNYRSTTNIVRFCNLIQLKRGQLFDIHDLTPQTSWSVEEGGGPAYFLDDDLSCRQILKEQTELVIVVPCQEGEEKAFIQKDEFLRGIALDKGEIVRNVLSPMRAKGLEFARVVLYKFGNEAVEQELAKLMERIDSATALELDRGQTLGLEYFFNSVYVGASRAQRRLFVVDTQIGLRQFWRFATDAATVESLLTSKRQKNWNTSDVHHMLRGNNESWAVDRDDPRALAERFYQQGQQENSAYLLQLARTQFGALGDEAKQERCTALIADYEGRHSDAAVSFVRLNELGEGIRCYWEAGDYPKVIEIAGRDPGRFLNNSFFIASKFLTETQDSDSATVFLKNLGLVGAVGNKDSFANPRWTDVIATAVEILGKSAMAVELIPSASLGTGYKVIESLRSEQGLVLGDSKALAALAFHAGNHQSTVDIWEKLEKRPRFEPRFVIRARATISPYPENLRWYGRLKDSKAIIEEYRQKGDAGLDNFVREIVLDSALSLLNYDLAVDVSLRTGQADLLSSRQYRRQMEH